MLTKQQKIDIIEYMSGTSVKAIFEDVDSVGETVTDDNYDQLRDEIYDFVDEWKSVLRKWVESEHS